MSRPTHPTCPPEDDELSYEERANAAAEAVRLVTTTLAAHDHD
jgi:hypothetical protein